MMYIKKIVDKPEEVPFQSPRSQLKKWNGEFGLWAFNKILWATMTHPTPYS